MEHADSMSWFSTSTKFPFISYSNSSSVITAPNMSRGKEQGERLKARVLTPVTIWFWLLLQNRGSTRGITGMKQTRWQEETCRNLAVITYKKNVTEKTSNPSATPDGHRAGSGTATLVFGGTILSFPLCWRFPSSLGFISTGGWCRGGRGGREISAVFVLPLRKDEMKMPKSLGHDAALEL